MFAQAPVGCQCDAEFGVKKKEGAQAVSEGQRSGLPAGLERQIVDRPDGERSQAMMRRMKASGARRTYLVLPEAVCFIERRQTHGDDEAVHPAADQPDDLAHRDRALR